MNNLTDKTRFLASHEWVKIEEDGSATIGISDFAQEQLGDIVFVELPEISSNVSAGDEVAVVESVKAASEICSPLSGEIIGINESLEDSPEIINSSPYDEGWFYKITPTNIDEFDSLLNEQEYKDSCEE